jgi:cytochrome d ubiquinol oxidase subunit I
MDALLLHRLHFASPLPILLFPQLTMGLALLIVVLKTVAWSVTTSASRNRSLLGKNVAINFLIGVVTGIPLEFQFGTNWAQFSAPPAA